MAAVSQKSAKNCSFRIWVLGYLQVLGKEKMSGQGQVVSESVQQFEKRKQDHITLSLDPRNEAVGFSGLDSIQLQHQPFPEINFSRCTN